MNARHILGAAILLWLFAVTGTGLVALTFDATAERIEENRRLTLLRKLNELVPADAYDNDLLKSQLLLPPDPLLDAEQTTTAWVARMNGEARSVVLGVSAPDGYSGSIRMLVGIESNGRVAGVRVVEHKETPGLGDAIEEQRSDWIRGFDGRSLADPRRDGWEVRKDGGEFDQLTGATITTRAVVKAVKNALLYFEAHREELVADPTKTGQQTVDG